jgi:hypothetical protein
MKRLTKTRKKNLVEEYQKILYYNKKTKKTYCELTVGIVLGNYLTLPLDLIRKLQRMYSNYSIQIDENNHTVLLANIKAVATCSKDDTFDEKKGKTVAYSKAQMKAYNLAKRVYSEISTYYGIKSAEFNNNWMSMVAYFNREVSFLKGM